MAATLKQQAALGRDQAFIPRVSAAVVAVALGVDAEPGATPNHAARLILATQVVQDPDTYGKKFAAVLPCGTQATQVTIGTAYASTNPANSDNVADADILTLVQLGWNVMAGA